MKANTIKTILTEKLMLDKIYVNNVNKHFQVIAIGNQFNGLTKVKRQQIIYEPLMEYILNKNIHALSIKTYTIDEWQHFVNNKKIYK